MSTTYHGTTYEAVKPDGRVCYSGPLRRARIWAKIFGGHVRAVGEK